MSRVSQADPKTGSAEWQALFDAAVAEYEQAWTSESEPANRLSMRRAQETERPAVDAGIEEKMHALMIKAARSGILPTYKVDNVLADVQQTFGIEIEFEGCSGDAVAFLLHRAGLTASPEQKGYHSGRVPGKWTVEKDHSVKGGEVVSPILNDTPATWVQIQTVCQTIKALGGKTNARTGGHIHIGTGADRGSEANKHFRVVEICAWSEDLLFRVASNTDGRRLPRLLSRNGALKHRGAVVGYEWCGPLGKFGNMQNGHHYALNFQHTNPRRSGTIEFRHFDSTIDPVRLQGNIMLASAIVNKAAGLASSEQIPKERNPLGTHRSKEDPQDRLLREFAAFLFPDPRDRLGLYSLYAASSWQPSPAQVRLSPIRRIRHGVGGIT